MSKLNHDSLVENIRKLLKKSNMSQQQLADAIGMTQANVSKALNPNDKRCFTLEQVYAIAQHFNASIDELVGNTAYDEISTEPRAILDFITKLLRDSKLKAFRTVVTETVYEPFINDGELDCFPHDKKIEYTAFYFPDYNQIEDYKLSQNEAEELYDMYLNLGNESRFKKLNEIFKKIIPIIKLYRETDIPDEAFQMILDGYLEQLPKK